MIPKATELARKDKRRTYNEIIKAQQDQISELKRISCRRGTDNKRLKEENSKLTKIINSVNQLTTP